MGHDGNGKGWKAENDGFRPSEIMKFVGADRRNGEAMFFTGDRVMDTP